MQVGHRAVGHARSQARVVSYPLPLLRCISYERLVRAAQGASGIVIEMNRVDTRHACEEHDVGEGIALPVEATVTTEPA